MQQLQIPEEGDFNKLYQILDEIKKLLLEPRRVEKPANLTPAEKELSEIEYFIPLHLAWEKLSIGESTWYRTYQNVIKHKKYGKQVWVDTRSINEFLNKDNINP